MGKRFSFLSRGTFTRCQRWSSFEVENLIALVEVEKLNWDEIAEEVGRSKNACEIRYRLTGRGAYQGHPDESQNVSAREKAIAERDSRHAAILARNEAAAAHGDVSFLIGDLPPPGMSALDKMRART